MLAIGDVQGLWRRSLIHWPDGRRDVTTSVTWLQGPNDYADLRVPQQRPDFSGITALNDLTREQMLFLASQEGFAGQLSFDGRFFEWHRHIDYQPKSAMADAGRLWFEDGRMIEEGRDVRYIEHCTATRIPCDCRAEPSDFRTKQAKRRASLSAPARTLCTRATVPNRCIQAAHCWNRLARRLMMRCAPQSTARYRSAALACLAGPLRHQACHFARAPISGLR